ncbi:MAG TPA: hypothetical protein VK983_04350 [Candidatus Limnocylindrales bacterium]|nr:hypothetical protein [Candidatus Limnocylindrales bacterium]
MAEKTAKPAPKTAKVFDIAKPGRQAAAPATARPVIVTNRTIMHDPMVTAVSDEVPSAPPLTQTLKVVIKPLSESEGEPEPVKKAGKPTPADSIIKKIELQPLNGPTGHAAKPSDAERATPEVLPEPDQTVPALDGGTTGQSPSTQQTKLDDPEAVPTKIDKIFQTPHDEEHDAAGDEPKDPALSTADATPIPTPTNDSIGSNTESEQVSSDAATSKAVAAAEKEATEQAALEELVQSEQYFLPLNAVERRRSRLAAIFGTLLIVLLAAALFELMLDAGFVTLPGIQPITTFF